MRFLLLAFCLFNISCSLHQNSQKTLSDKMLDCVNSMVGKHGVEAIKAKDTCIGIYRPSSSSDLEDT